MKHLRILFASVLLLAVFTARAADTVATMTVPGSPIVILNGGTNKLVAFSTNGPYYFSVPEQTDVTLYLSVKYLNAVGSGDANGIRLDVYPGIDGSTFGEDLFLQRNFLANSTTTTAKATVTNQVVAAISHFKAYLVNPSTNAHVTNLVFWIKPKTVAAKQR